MTFVVSSKAKQSWTNVSGPPAWSIFAIKHRQATTKRRYDRKYMHILTVLLINMFKS